jgi:microcystin-dependent protein
MFPFTLFPVIDPATQMEFQRHAEILELPIGITVIYFGVDAPYGWIWLEGQWLSKREYQDLYNLLLESGEVSVEGETDAGDIFRLPNINRQIIKV